jgi:hypothetical protein
MSAIHSNVLSNSVFLGEPDPELQIWRRLTPSCLA